MVSFDLNEDENEEAYVILATGLWEYQNWVIQNWSKDNLKDQQKFNREVFLTNKIKNNLVNLWKDKLVVSGNFRITTTGCEWAHQFSFNNKNQKGSGAEPYYYKYIKYKTKYNNLKASGFKPGGL